MENSFCRESFQGKPSRRLCEEGSRENGTAVVYRGDFSCCLRTRVQKTPPWCCGRGGRSLDEGCIIETRFKNAGGCPGTQAVAERAGLGPGRGVSPGQSPLQPPPVRAVGLCRGRRDPPQPPRLPCAAPLPGGCKAALHSAPLPAAKDTGTRPEGVVPSPPPPPPPHRDAPGLPPAKAAFASEADLPGAGTAWELRGQGIEGQSPSAAPGTFSHAETRPGVFVPRPGTCAGRYPPVPPGRSLSRPGDDASLSPLCRGIPIPALSILRWQPLLLPHPSPRGTAASCVDGSAAAAPFFPLDR